MTFALFLCRWGMKLSLNDRAFILLILTLCFCVPTFIIITSYLAIFYTVRCQWS